MNKFYFLIFLFLLFNIGCSNPMLKTRNKIDLSDASEVSCSLEFFNDSNDTLYIPKRLIITPNKDNTLNGVMHVRRKTGLFSSTKVESKEFDYSIPLDYVVEGLDKDHMRMLLPGQTYTYDIELAPFYTNLIPGKYLLKICLSNILSNSSSFTQEIRSSFRIENN